MTLTIDIAIPESVWDDFLSPSVSTMESDLGLRDRRADPFFQRAGRGGRRRYAAVPVDVAGELASYLIDRADTLLGQGIVDPDDPLLGQGIVDPDDPFEKADRDMLRRAIQAGARIRTDIAAAGRAEVHRRTGEPVQSR